MLWVDKYRPHTLDQMTTVNTDIAQHLKRLVQDGDCPHLLFYGVGGAGKKTLALAVLREIFGAAVEKVKVEGKTWKLEQGERKIEVELTTMSSNYHVEMNPSDVGTKDRYVVQEVIKDMAKSRPVDAAGQQGYKVLLLNEVDRLSKEAQHGLRRTMEKYSSACRLILICTSVSKVLDAVRSQSQRFWDERGQHMPDWWQQIPIVPDRLLVSPLQAQAEQRGAGNQRHQQLQRQQAQHKRRQPALPAPLPGGPPGLDRLNQGGIGQGGCHHRPDPMGLQHRCRKSAQATEGIADQDGGLLHHLLQKSIHLHSPDPVVQSACRLVRGTEPKQVEAEDPPAGLGQPWCSVAPVAACCTEAVQQQNGWALFGAELSPMACLALPMPEMVFPPVGRLVCSCGHSPDASGPSLSRRGSGAAAR